MAEVTPITLVIGLPGAGKTTLLRDLLRRPGMADIALVAAPPDPPMWWGGGCPCCAPRDDVARALRALLPRVRRDEVRRVVIETSGMADPGRDYLNSIKTDAGTQHVSSGAQWFQSGVN
jgi:G3E family GTPase